MGKLIGKGGKTVQAIRMLLGAMASKVGERIYLKVVDPKE
jgi:predicted RNA-binding protein YlqC (UPF0109 family)